MKKNIINSLKAAFVMRIFWKLCQHICLEDVYVKIEKSRVNPLECLNQVSDKYFGLVVLLFKNIYRTIKLV